MSHRREVIVVGGGQAGLAIGYLLARQGRRFTILEAADTPAAVVAYLTDYARDFELPVELGSSECHGPQDVSALGPPRSTAAPA